MTTLTKSDNIEVRESPGKGRGMFTSLALSENEKIISEVPAVLGPKQTSPFVCIDCFDYINEQTVNPCRLCGLPLCPDCFKMGMPKYHNVECKLFEESAAFKLDPVTTYKQAKTIYMYLTPLRLLLKAEICPDLMALDSNLQDREDTLIYFLTISHVIKPIKKLLGGLERFSEDAIQRACGILDTNCYEIKWDRGVARGLFQNVALINHSCIPNCRKFFDAQRTMHVFSSCPIDSSQELHLSYTNPLLSTPMRQAILNQTKCFKCTCPRCQDPLELGAGLSAMKCKNKSANCKGLANLVDPLCLDSDLKCDECQEIISCDMAKMMQDTAMNSAHSADNDVTAQDILDVLSNLDRFLPQSNHIMVELKVRLMDKVIENENLRLEFEEKAIEFCFQLLKLAQIIAPGRSKLRGVLSMKYHQLTEKGPNPLILPKACVDKMFAEDQSVLLLD